MPDKFVARTKAKPENKKLTVDHPLADFLFMPDGVTFENQEPDETIILVLRKNFITNFSWLFITLVLLIIPVTLFPFVLLNDFFPSAAHSLFRIITPVWYLFTASYVLVNFIVWYFTVSIVTTERILDIDFINILQKKEAETRLNKVEDVTQKTGGFFGAFFDYGDVIVQTAAHEPYFLFESVSHPQQIVRIINQLLDRQED